MPEQAENTRPLLAPVAGVGVVITNREDLVLVRRGKPPREAQWSIPGGRVEWGETVQDALHREIMEETGLVVRITRLIDVVDLVTHDSSGAVIAHYVLIDFAAEHVSGELRAGSDATEARWVNRKLLDGYSLWDETRRIIERAFAKD
jgi:8-oxo-dGTP diphosphatase